MTDADRLEEIEAAVGLNYCFTSDNWSGKQARSPQQDERWLIFKLKERDREIERAGEKIDKLAGMVQKTRAELVGAEDKIKHQREVIIEDIADNRRLQERVEELEEMHRHYHVGPNRACAECGKDLTDNLHIRQALQRKEGE